MSIEAMKLALDWIEGNGKYEDWPSIATALRQAIEQAQKQEALDRKADNAIELGLDYEPEPIRLECVKCGTVYADGIPPRQPEQEPIGEVVTAGVIRWKDKYPSLGTKLYTSPQRQPEQEPVGEAYLCDACHTPFDGAFQCPSCGHGRATKEPVYTAPPQRQPEQEPVAVTAEMARAFHRAISDGPLGQADEFEIQTGLEAAFAHIITPPQRQWVGLTYEDMVNLQKDLYDTNGENVLPTTFARAVETKLKEKNT